MQENLDDVVRKTATERMTEQRVANLQELMTYFDPELAADIGGFILGKLYSRSVIPWKTRQLCAIAALSVLYRPEQLRGHIIYALQAGATKEEIGEVIVQMAIYGGFPAAIEALKVAKEVIEQRV
ncbi:MAG: carboxymuconolactone decarboxylase family protein [Candidatus Abyssobacteria bacterium SURF_5]|uniref:Carboxymuconolactone decarboxylase family protein n=1 Tax=Abyssobacteria bacterium (strain SURF_5) TaxID=2093360 RepID=A0A3A4P731_ABYX5|nr:MAG: carboxymuconolactone decarboxylase family protein [Candidatus Abyssubacteria bacterium SURF_5]